MITRKTIAVLLCLVFITTSFVSLHQSLEKQEQHINELSYKLEEQISETERLSTLTKNWQLEIDNLYEMNKSHANCVAMAVLMNEDSVLADAYNRTEEEQVDLYSNDNAFVNFYGRLYVPNAMIDVALYKGNSQAICDRQDSANIFALGLDEGKTIADHSNQEFRKLFDVTIGTDGYIELKNGDIINIVCINVFNGHNNGVYITDEEGNNVMDVADYMMYTCRNGWRNVRICLWDKK